MPYIERLARCVEGLPLQACERSVKLDRGGVWPNRFLLGVDRAHIDAGHLRRTCRTLGMPGACQRRVDAALEDANAVLYGFEEDAAGAVFKVYFEYWERVRRAVRGGSRARQLMFQGFKWRADDPAQHTASFYHCRPVIPAHEIVARIRGICGAASRAAGAAAADIIQRATRAAPATPLIYLEVTEPGSPRRSFDLNLYGAALRVADTAPAIRALCRAWGIEARAFRDGVESPRCIVGHISGGLGREGGGFFTLYYDTGPES